VSWWPSCPHVENQHKLSTTVIWNATVVYELYFSRPILTTLGAWTDSLDNFSELQKERIWDRWLIDTKNDYLLNWCENPRSWIGLTILIRLIFKSYRFIVVHTRKWRRDDILVVPTSRCSFVTVSLWDGANCFKKLGLVEYLWKSAVRSSFKYLITFIAAKWTVCGIQRMRASRAKNLTPCSSHRCSKDTMSVSLLLVLSITIAMTC